MKELKISGELPIRTVGIENERERKNFSDLPPQNYLHIWFARRPTPVTRLAVLSSVLPKDIDDDQLLSWMAFDPDNKPKSKSISSHVREKWTNKDDRDGALYDHYGYKKIYKRLPDDIEELHKEVKETWDGELPTILDATAGGGSIPFESVRYGFPTIANELNPVASVILKGVLEHPRVDGDLSEQIRQYGEEINKRTRKKIDSYFPTRDNEKILEYLWAHTIPCQDCGLEIPLAPDWWLHKKSSSEGIAAQPTIDDENDRLRFSVVELPQDTTKEEFNPTDGTISYAKAECPRCSVVMESDTVREQIRENELPAQMYAIHYESLEKGEGRGFRAPNKEDIEAFRSAKNKVESDPDLSSFLSTEVPSGFNTDQALRYGINEFRDMFSTRQLLAHYSYLESFNEIQPEIYDEYSEKVANAIMTYLSFTADKALDYNSRFSSWHNSRAVVRNTFERQDFAFSWSFTESNLLSEGLGYEWALDNILTSYADLYDLSHNSEASCRVLQGDAGQLELEDEEVEAVILDPPYYDNIMYSEISDFFYVWMNHYLGNVYPEFFTQQLSEKSEEAIANPARFRDIAGAGSSASELAEESYESKMEDIFEELHRVLDSDGIFTMMFTHKKTEAWDTLTQALIEAGFVINATHPLSTEDPNRIGQAQKNSAESTILLSSRKRSIENPDSTLWEDIQKKTTEVAKDKVEQLEQEEINFSKVDMVLASFGPALEVFTKNYPVVDSEGETVTPDVALDNARTAVLDYFNEKYLQGNALDVDTKTEWYVLCWLLFEAQRFPYDEARRLAIGVGEDLDSLKKRHRMWRKRSGDVVLRPHEDRVQDIKKNKNARSGRKPVDPEALSFIVDLDKVHAAMHIYDVKGATEAWNWMNDRNCGSDPAFKSTLEALLRVLPHENHDWELARDLAAGETGNLLNLDLDTDIFNEENSDDDDKQGSLKDF